jgi:LmbE family N-acetylglucosaminyl deacetylase
MDADAVFAAENVLVLAARPGEAVRHCGALIARLCRQGRPPFVVVLTDGNAAGKEADRQARAELAACGLDGGRLLMFGIAGEVPEAGSLFQAAVAALGFVSWRHDCNVLCAPDASLPVARAAAAASGLGLVGADEGVFHLLAPPRPSARDTDRPPA